MWKLLLGHDEVLKAEKYLDCIPYLFENDPEIEKAKETTKTILAHTRSIDAFFKYYEGYCDESVPMETEITETNYLDRYFRLKASIETVEEWKRVHGRNPRILDLGCQDGWVSNRLAKLGYKVIGYDCTPRAKEIFEHNAKRLCLDSVFHLGMVENLDAHFKPQEFDVVLCLELIEHVIEDQKVIDSIHRLLSGDGVALISTPFGAWYPFYDQTPYAWDKPRPHLRAYTDKSLLPLMEKFGSVRHEVKLVGKDHPDQKVLLVWGHKKKSNGLDIVIWTGPAVEPWNPPMVEEKGMGGSETACIQMSKELAYLGHRVTVYGDCEGKEGLFEGVEYKHYPRINEVKECDILISSRQPSIVAAPIKAKAKFLWIHDIHVGPCTPEVHMWLLKFDRILCLSDWHRKFVLQQYPFLHESKVIQTRNGIDLSRFQGVKVGHRKNKLIFSSSADRGLDPLLNMMPTIRARVPDAELHIYYGFDWWKKFAEMGNDKDSLERIAALEKKIAATPGVIFHGRVNQKELAEAFLSSKVWAYPTWFTETSCCHPDTRISVPGDHRGGAPTVRIADMVGKSGFPVYAFNEKENRFQIATCKKVWMTKVAEELVGLRLDNGDILRLTPDHMVLTFDGDWVEAGSLKVGDSLRALHYRYNVAIRDANGRWTDESRLVGEWKEGRQLGHDEHVDHADLERLDNTPDRLTVMSASEHHSKTHKGRKQSKSQQGRRVAGWKEWAAGEGKEELHTRLAKNGKKLWDTVNAMSPEDRAAWCKKRGIKKKGTMDRTGKNHSIVEVVKLAGSPVYDMEVEGLHNFVADGVVVHNCISAMEAQAAGCVPVTTRLAALGETVKVGLLLDPPNTDRGYQDRFIDYVVKMLTNHTEYEKQAFMGVLESLKLGWNVLAKDWEEMFKKTIKEVAENPVPRYGGEYL